MKRRSGITFLALLTTIVIALIIIFTAVIGYDNIVSSTRKSEFAREMYTVRNLVLDYEFMNSSYPLKEAITIDLSDVIDDDKTQFSDEPYYSTNGIILYNIDLSKSGVQTILRGTKKDGENDVYAFSITTKKIYYLAGEMIGDSTYYTLTDELYKLISISNVK